MASRGGLELLFGNKRAHQIQLPKQAQDGKDLCIRQLLPYIRDNLLTERQELFMQGDTMCAYYVRCRPG